MVALDMAVNGGDDDGRSEMRREMMMIVMAGDQQPNVGPFDCSRSYDPRTATDAERRETLVAIPSGVYFVRGR